MPVGDAFIEVSKALLVELEWIEALDPRGVRDEWIAS
jgi:hypothetical protein